MVREGATIEDGLVRWRSNGAVPPREVLEHAHQGGVEGIDLERCAAVRDAETAAAFEEYRRNQPAEPSAEERAGALAAFGAGVEVVDAISGRRFRT
jgi:hypothetical protein